MMYKQRRFHFECQFGNSNNSYRIPRKPQSIGQLDNLVRISSIFHYCCNWHIYLDIDWLPGHPANIDMKIKHFQYTSF